MRWLRRRPVLYRWQVQVWLVLMVTASAMTLVFVPTGRRQVIALVVLGLAVVAAAVVWKVSEYRRYRLGPLTSTGSIASSMVGTACILSCSRIIGSGGTLLATVAGFLAGCALMVPVTAYLTAFNEPLPEQIVTTSSDGSAPHQD